MHEQYDRMVRLGAEVLVVTFSPPERIPPYLEDHGWPFSVVADPETEGYRAFDLPKGSCWQIAGPRAISKYLGLMIRGRMPHMPTTDDDVKQLGGDFVLDASGRLLYIHRSRDSTDRPGGHELLKAVAEASEQTERGG